MSQFISSLMGPNGVILLGALISAAGVLWSSVQQGEVNNKLQSQSDEIVTKTKKIEEQGEKLVEQSDTITLLNHELISHTTGGDSYPELIISSLNDMTNKGGLVISNNSDKYNMFDLQLRIVDLDSKAPRTIENILGDDVLINVNNLAPKTVMTHSMVTLGNINVIEKKFNIFSQTRNGNFTQFLRLQKVNGHWEVATMIKNAQNDVLKEKISNDFPRNVNGEVVW
ncbi:hypothetical protein [Vibrio hepatarius]|uniref:hypothetical protein n=1 Tax=Vibrio hepatarius TaxID=171383 RepID=UPI0029325C32|nr:hypothetical protein [Vibrio vulnificus]